MSFPPNRARPLAVEDRREAILDAVAPLIAAHGFDLTSKQLAEAAGVAEGTIFRAFGDKETLIDAAVARLLDPEPLRAELQAIDRALPIEAKVSILVTLLQHRFGAVFRIAALVGRDRLPAHHDRKHYIGLVSDVLRGDHPELNWATEQVAHIVRMIAFSASFSQLNAGHEFTADELTRIVLYGVAGRPGVTES